MPTWTQGLLGAATVGLIWIVVYGITKFLDRRDERIRKGK